MPNFTINILSMKKGWVMAGLVLLLACGGSESGPTSAEGKWTYTTPDGKVNVTFELVKSGTNSLNIQNPTIKINGTNYQAAAIISGVALPVIGSITINANDAAAVYSYPVNFTNGQVSNDFRTIAVPTATYVYPNPMVNNLTNITVTRP